MTSAKISSNFSPISGTGYEIIVKLRFLGKDENKTDLKVQLYRLSNPDKETIFENCVADVNIPVGEVFTSPVLEGTNGTLHVSKVYLNELLYKNLAMEFVDDYRPSYPHPMNSTYRLLQNAAPSSRQ